MNNISLTLSYDGGAYFGWQKTSSGPTIELKLQEALLTLFNQKFPLQAASRTDKGVHAKKQIVNFFIDKEIELDFLKYKLNCLLPKDIRVIEIKKELKNFHPTLNCFKKQYNYYISSEPYQNPIIRYYSWHIHHILNLDHMIQASKIFIGKHNFIGFSNRLEKNPQKEIFQIDIKKENNQITISIIGNSFLYKMVRNIVGALVDVARGKITIDALQKYLESNTFQKPFITAPAHGLFLYDLFY